MFFVVPFNKVIAVRYNLKLVVIWLTINITMIMTFVSFLVNNLAAKRYSVCRYPKFYIAEVQWYFLVQIHRLRNGGDDYSEEPVEVHHVEEAFVDSLL